MPENKKKILIVEDETPLREALAVKFLANNFVVLQERNGEAGLHTALAEHPDIILLDIMMPVMDGLSMLARLREDPWGSRVKVVLLTNVNDVDVLAQAAATQTFDYIIKSDWKIEDVVTFVNSKLTSV